MILVHARFEVLTAVFLDIPLFRNVIVVQSPTLQNYSKGTVTPVQTPRDPEDSRRLRLPDFQTIGT
jgi:hypothetical protein